MIHGLHLGFSNFPIIKYKLRLQIDIDAFMPMELFVFKRVYKMGNKWRTDTLKCKIKGIRGKSSGSSEPA